MELQSSSFKPASQHASAASSRPLADGGVNDIGWGLTDQRACTWALSAVRRLGLDRPLAVQVVLNCLVHVKPALDKAGVESSQKRSIQDGALPVLLASVWALHMIHMHGILPVLRLSASKHIVGQLMVGSSVSALCRVEVQLKGMHQTTAAFCYKIHPYYIRAERRHKRGQAALTPVETLPSKTDSLSTESSSSCFSLATVSLLLEVA